MEGAQLKDVMHGFFLCKDCDDLPEGLQTIQIHGKVHKVSCEADGWLVFQSRGQFGNPEDFFFKDWQAYLNPFGTPGKIILHIETNKDDDIP